MVLRVLSDSLSTLQMLIRMKSSGPGTNVIAREMALDVAECHYTPTVLEHVRGPTNKVADQLSRLYAPDPQSFPHVLLNAKGFEITKRNKSMFRTLERT